MSPRPPESPTRPFSRVINSHPSVRQSTRERVLAVIDELGFRRNTTALALAGGRHRAVTVLAADTTHYGYASILRGVEEAARAATHAVGVGVLESADEAAVAAEVQRAADVSGGLIVIAYDPAGVRALEAVPAGVPVVGVVETPVDAPSGDLPWVWTDDREAAPPGDPASAVPGPRDRAPRGHPLLHPTHRRPYRGPAAGAGGGRCARTPCRAGGLGTRRRPRGRPGPRRGSVGDGDPVRQRRPRAGRAARPARGGPPGAGRGQRGRVRRRPVRRLSHTLFGRAAFALLHGVLEKSAPVDPHPVSAPELVVRESTGRAPA